MTNEQIAKLDGTIVAFAELLCQLLLKQSKDERVALISRTLVSIDQAEAQGAASAEDKAMIARVRGEANLALRRLAQRVESLEATTRQG